MIEYSAGIVTAYGSAVRAGYTGTYEDFCRQQAQYAENAQAVEQAKNIAVSAKDDAVTAKNNAVSAKDDAVSAKNTAVSAKDDAVSAKNTATTKAQEASASATSAGLSATSASQSADDAEQSAQSVSGSLTQIATNTSDISQLKADLVEVSNQPNISWIIGSSIGLDGNIGPASSYAYSSAIAVDAGGRIKRSTSYRDADSRILLIHVCQYDSLGAFISRTTLADGGEVVFESNTASIRFNFGRAASLGVPMTAEDVTTYFREKVYRKAVLEVDVNDIIEAKIAERVQPNDLINITISKSIATNSYNNDLKQVPTNTYFFTSYSWFNDYPHGIGATYFWVITLSSERDDRSAAVSVGSQICINPTNGNYAVRRILSGVWTEWSVINVPQYVSMPKYAAFGDSLTFGAVWDSEQETQWYQADFKDQIPTRIANAIGSNAFTNYGVSGARFVKQSPSDTSTIIGDKVKSVNLTDIDLVTIGGGRNDSATSLGDGTTATANDGTICGAVVDILTYLTTTYPKLQIVMYGVTPQPTSTSHDPEHIFTRVFGGGWSLATYYTEMSKVCARFGVPFIDWYDCPLILRWGVLSGGYSSGVQNWSHPLESSIYKQMGNYLGGRVSGYYRG
jgi:hypothetical protein